jgi:uncharacterized membrane protein HdeD (DUF308 family)
MNSSRFTYYSRSLPGGGWWLMMAPGILLILFGLAILIWPQLLAYLVAGALIFVGVLLTLWAWRVRRLARGMQSGQNSTIYYEDW